MTMAGLVLRREIGAVSLLTLNRPARLNALSPDVFIDLAAHLDAIEAAGDAVRCVVIEGAGRSFCAGADMEALRAGVVTDDPEFRSRTIERLGALPQAVVAAVQGHCYTGGLELALAADIIVAADDARFCDTHAKLGIIPRWGLSARLPRRIGAAAKLFSMLAEPVGAEEALRLGLCDMVVARETLQEATIGIATRIAGNSFRSVAAIKHLYDRSASATLADALDYERKFSPPGGGLKGAAG
jgi:enoyl-CoA hydratase/carnithine racemase